MNIQKALLSSGLQTLDAEVLLASALGVSREQLIIQASRELTPEELRTWEEYVDRRKAKEPVAYITGIKEFYGRQFDVTKDTLIPRPATEGLVDATLELLKTGKPTCKEVDTEVSVCSAVLGDIDDVTTVVDIGTGTGCVAITVKLMRPELTVIATDVSEHALAVAQENAATLQADIEFLLGSYTEPIRQLNQPFVLVSNPPYIPTTEPLESTVKDYEPHLALFSGADGMNALKEIVKQATNHPYCRGVCIECKTDQWTLLKM